MTKHDDLMDELKMTDKEEHKKAAVARKHAVDAEDTLEQEEKHVKKLVEVEDALAAEEFGDTNTQITVKKKEKEIIDDEPKKVAAPAAEMKTHIFALRTTANREDQVMSFLASNVQRKKIPVYSLIRPHGVNGYIFVEAEAAGDAEQAAFGVPYARGVLPKEIAYKEIEHMLERGKKEVNILKNDIVELIAGPFKREKAKITRVDKTKGEVVVELLEAAVPIPLTLRLDDVKVIRRDNEESSG